MEDYSKATEALQMAQSLYNSLDDKRGIAIITGMLGEISLSMQDRSAALDQFHQAIRLLQREDETELVRRYTCMVVTVLIKQGDIERAAETFSKIDTAEISDPNERIPVEIAHALLLNAGGQRSAATASLERCLALSREYGLKRQEMAVHSELRDFARVDRDLAAYILHNDECQRVGEEISSRESAIQLALSSKEKEILAEREERERERAVLYSTLPKTVADRIISGELVTGDHFDEAAVLFADVVGFSHNSAGTGASQVTALLAQIFEDFDEACERYAVTKVKTIGDSYMCFCAEGNALVNATAVANVAAHIVDSNFTWPGGSDRSEQQQSRVQFRVGVAIGPLVAGVIGTDRLQYDVWGDTVNTASRLESTGEAGRIQVNESFVHALAEAPFQLIPRGTIEVKGKGAIHTWWLESRI
ncbi:MAG: hypothetical protein OKBPIBMD_01463 [Chlorobi bacterium]|nr:MAG: adenylate/guanylate cyclase domain-containing protein [Bacteroidota bacterium]MBV6464012.1 hypothetical protein [Chlorobiota bacterium]